MPSHLTEITGNDLTSLVAELMVRKGYTVEQNPRVYQDIDIIAVKSGDSNNINKYFIITAGRKTNRYLTKGDVLNALPDPIDLSESSRLLLVTTRRSSSREARKVAATDPTKKQVWYVDNMLKQLRKANSEYLVKMYMSENFRFDTEENLKSRFNHQGIRVESEKIKYIVSETHYPRKIIAHIEFNARNNPSPVENSPSVETFQEKFST